MKKLALLVLALVIGTMSAFASMAEDPVKPNEVLRNEIIDLLETPDFVVMKDIKVTIKFTFNSEGEMVVLCPGCKNKEMVSYIAKNLNYKKFENPGVRDKIYRMPIVIKAT